MCKNWGSLNVFEGYQASFYTPSNIVDDDNDERVNHKHNLFLNDEIVKNVRKNLFF